MTPVPSKTAAAPTSIALQPPSADNSSGMKHLGIGTRIDLQAFIVTAHSRQRRCSPGVTEVKYSNSHESVESTTMPCSAMILS